MSLNNFIVDYVSESVKNKLKPVERAKAELKEIETKIAEADTLFLQKKKLLAVLDYCGYKTLGKNKDQSTIDSSEEDLELLSTIENKITDVLKVKEGLTVREIINSVGDYDEDRLIIKSIKKLGSSGLIKKNDENLKYSLV